MRLKISKSKNTTSLYVIKSTYEKGKRSSKVVEKLGTTAEIKKKYPDCDPLTWAKEYIEMLNEKDKANKREVIVRYLPTKLIEKDERRLFGGGYLFLQRLYHDLKLDVVCKDISGRYRFDFNLDEILSRLVYGRILNPSSKLACHRWQKTLIESTAADKHHYYRALEVLARESDFIQSELYKNSKKIQQRNDSILYYDCTNFFFEIEQEEGDKQYGHSKENRPNPIVQMGLFMDGDGIPLAFSITPGNTNEQSTLIPLEKKIMSDFEHSKFIVCTDAGLSSAANRKFNDTAERSFITTQSIKKLKGYLKAWALEESGWKLTSDGPDINIADLDEKTHYNSVFFKERWINDGELQQRLVITFSLKYRTYQRHIRNGQIERAVKLMDSNPKKIGSPRQNDFKRFISKTQVTSNGEIAEKAHYAINSAKITEEEAYDGFYAVCTNLEDEASKIAEINSRRWEIEECFRIMKHELKARPAYLSRDDRIKAHFMTCFIALIVYRLLEKRLDEKYTCTEIIDALRAMNFMKVKGEGYIPTFTRDNFTDDLHKEFGFRTDFQIVTTQQMRKIIRMTKKH